ncbi:hypothetical protein OESDEN_18847, partial [Oesophagostomum dentatum]
LSKAFQISDELESRRSPRDEFAIRARFRSAASSSGGQRRRMVCEWRSIHLPRNSYSRRWKSCLYTNRGFGILRGQPAGLMAAHWKSTGHFQEGDRGRRRGRRNCRALLNANLNGRKSCFTAGASINLAFLSVSDIISFLCENESMHFLLLLFSLS